MDYIVVDFEWNQSPYGKGTGNKKLPFEIIEIGAVKLDENRQYVESFSEIIRPRVYKKLHYMTRELTGITQEELDGGEPFNHVIVDFMLWCGDDFMFCTWGNTDLIELQRNMKHYHLDDLLPGPLKYYNVQKLFRILHDPMERRSCALETAVDYFGFEKDGSFHRAVNDAEYTAKIFAAMDMEKLQRLYSVDYYQNPQIKADEIHLDYDNYSKYISREFDSREEAMADKEVRTTRCYLCGRAAVKKVHWFLGRNRAYYCLAYCKTHGLIRGKIRFKKTDDDRLFVVKTIRLISEEEAAEIREMKKEVVEKRREKRHKESCL